jgi:glycosyltransferase involved in cell wall biosynthesis
MKVLIVLDYYLPAYRGGGPTRSIANLVTGLGAHLDFWVLTRNHDYNCSTEYPNIVTNAWNDVGSAKIYYSSDDNLTFSGIYRIVKSVSPDVLYLNSFFGRLEMRCLLLRQLQMLPHIPIILAPRGELSAGALGISRLKKWIYTTLARFTGLYRRINWHASSATEAAEIRRLFGANCTVRIAPNMPNVEASAMSRCSTTRKSSSTLRLVFLSRVVPMKNLLQALSCLSSVSGDITFDIYGTLPSESYWRKCQDLLAKLPWNVRANYRGIVKHEQVVDVLSGYHFLILPTLGENFGHVIFEAMTAGCPVIISDRTPWRQLTEKGAGWDLPLERPELWQDVLQQCIDMDESTYNRLRRSTLKFARDWASASEIPNSNLRLFLSLDNAEAIMQKW